MQLRPKTKVKYEKCKVNNSFWEFVKKYKPPNNIGGTSCYFNVAVRFFTSFPYLSDALSRWSELDGNKEILTLGELEEKSKKGKITSKEEIWLSFFKTLQLINKSKDGDDVNDAFIILYSYFCRISGLGQGQQSASEAISILKQKFEDLCIEEGQELATCVCKSCSFSLNENGDFKENTGSENVVSEFFTDPFSGEEYRPDCGLDKVFINEGNYDSYSFTFLEKKYSDIMVSEGMFCPIKIGNNLSERTLKFNNVDIKTNKVNLKNIATTKLNDKKYGLAIFGNHDGGLDGGHYTLFAFEKPGEIGKITQYNDRIKKELLSGYENASHISPVMYVKQDIKENDELSCFFDKNKESLKRLFEEKNIDDVVTNDIKKEFIELATRIEKEKIKTYRNIIKKILGCVDASEDLKNELKGHVPKVFYDDTVEIDVRFNPTKEEMTSENNVFSLSERNKINIVSGIGGYEGAGVILGILSKIYREKKNKDMTLDDAQHIQNCLVEINKVSLEPGEENFRIAAGILFRKSNEIIKRLRELGLNIENIQKSNVKISPHTPKHTPPHTPKHTPLHTPISDRSDVKTQNKITPIQKKNSNINVRKKSIDDVGKKEKGNKRNKDGNKKNENEKTSNNSIVTDYENENKTSKPPEINLIDILLCFLIIGIFIIIYKLIEQNKYNKIKNGGDVYNLNNTREKQRGIS